MRKKSYPKYISFMIPFIIIIVCIMLLIISMNITNEIFKGIIIISSIVAIIWAVARMLKVFLEMILIEFRR